MNVFLVEEQDSHDRRVMGIFSTYQLALDYVHDLDKLVTEEEIDRFIKQSPGYNLATQSKFDWRAYTERSIKNEKPVYNVYEFALDERW